MGKYLHISSYIRKPFLIYSMTLQLLHCEFLIYEENFILFLSVYMASPEVDKHPGGDEDGVDAHQALHQHQGHTNTLQYH